MISTLVTFMLALRRVWFRRHVHPLFDADYYRVANPDVAAAGAIPYRHYVIYGRREGRSPNAFFDPVHYSKRWRVPLVDVLDHYWLFGAALGYDPHPEFETNWYLRSYPDVATAKVNPLRHYLEYGRAEGRVPQSPRRSRLLVKAHMDGAVLTCCDGQLVLGPRGISQQVSSTVYPEYALVLWLSPLQFKFMQEYLIGNANTGVSSTQLALPSFNDGSVPSQYVWVSILMRMTTVFRSGGGTTFEFAEALIVKQIGGEPLFVGSYSGDFTSITWCSGPA